MRDYDERRKDDRSLMWAELEIFISDVGGARLVNIL